MHDTILKFGPIIIKSYALMLTIAFLIGTLLAVRRAEKHGIPSHELIKIVNVIIISSIIGSKLLFVFENLGVYSSDPISVLLIFRRGGFSYHGGLFFSFIGVFWWMKRKKIFSWGNIVDICTPSIVLGFFFVRIGCFLNGCCFGTPTDMPWGIVFPSDSPAGLIYKNTKIHPVQLYAAFSALVSFIILIAIEKRGHFVRRKGHLFFSFLILSAIWRFIIEFFRYQEFNSTLINWLTNAQVYSVTVLFFAIFILTRILQIDRRKNI